MRAQELIAQLGLQPHREGGYFRRTFEASHRAPVDTARGARLGVTSIYYLLTESSPIGRWHRNHSDILHFFHRGGPLRYHLIDPDGTYRSVCLGPDPRQGHELQLAVPGGVWKASVLEDGEYGLIGEAVAPGFDFADCELGRADALVEAYPQHRALIEAFAF